MAKKKQQKKQTENKSSEDKVLFSFAGKPAILPDTSKLKVPVTGCQDIENIGAVIQEANRLFFHPLGLEISQDNECFWIEKPEKQPKLEYGNDVISEIKNVKSVQEMRTVNTNKRIKSDGYRVQPVMVPIRAKK